MNNTLPGRVQKRGCSPACNRTHARIHARTHARKHELMHCCTPSQDQHRYLLSNGRRELSMVAARSAGLLHCCCCCLIQPVVAAAASQAVSRCKLLQTAALSLLLAVEHTRHWFLPAEPCHWPLLTKTLTPAAAEEVPAATRLLSLLPQAPPHLLVHLAAAPAASHPWPPGTAAAAASRTRVLLDVRDGDPAVIASSRRSSSTTRISSSSSDSSSSDSSSSDIHKQQESTTFHEHEAAATATTSSSRNTSHEQNPAPAIRPGKPVPGLLKPPT